MAAPLRAGRTPRIASEERALAVVHLREQEPAAVDLERVPAILGAAAPWLGARIEDDAEGRRRFVGDLELAVDGARRVAFRKSAIVTVGHPTTSPTGYEMAIEWQAASLAPLFPIFVGRLTVTPSWVRLDGFYAPPFGPVGVVVDRALLGAGARRVARWFLSSVIEALA